MKIRNGFVSNSSSCSFTILKSRLSESQISDLRDYKNVALRLTDAGYKEYSSDWNLTETESDMHFFTYMDNFDMREVFNELKIPSDAIKRS